MPSTAKRSREPVGALLAGGQGRRIGGAKACVPLAGRPLLAWPLAALTGALARVAVVAKADSELPALPPDVVAGTNRRCLATRSPGSSRRCGGPAGMRSWCAPSTCRSSTAALVARLAAADAGGAPAVIAVGGGGESGEGEGEGVRGGSGRGESRPQPLLGRYEPPALAALRAAPPDAPLAATVLASAPALLEVPAAALLNVNDERDLQVAEQRLRGGVVG